MIKKGNPDFVHGKLAPRASYALTGMQYSNSLQQSANSKFATEGPPMSILAVPPGVTQVEDDMWKLVYAASHDAFLTIINGTAVQTSIDEITLAGIYKAGSVNADNDNLWKLANNVSQIQYMAEGETAAAGAASAKTGNTQVSDIRGLGIRIPSMAGGYGRTIDGLPTDPQPAVDIRQNDEDHKLDRASWMYGPIEYRWDYRKRVWSAYNEMITDHYNKGLGTWVFGTNTDSDEGFPFLRARLEDAFWVRQPDALKTTLGTVEAEKTAELFTHLNHRWFDVEEEGAARLSSIFIIPHKDKTDETCHPKGDENTVGPETTGDGQAIDIKTGAHFFKDKGHDGPIFFGEKVSDLGDTVCCKPPDGKLFVGSMIFEDEAVDFCSSTTFDTGFVSAVVGEAEAPCRWIPAISIDECELVGGHFIDLIVNDVNLGVNLSSICNSVAKWSESVASNVTAGFDGVTTAVECFNDALGGLAGAATALIAESNLGHQIARQSLEARVQVAFDLLGDQINQALQACGCGAEIAVLIPLVNPGGDVGVSVPGGGLTVGQCDFTFEELTALDCSVCVGTEIWMPCATQDKVIAGRPCEGGDQHDIQTRFGSCQAHESKTAGAGRVGQGPFPQGGTISGEGL